MTQSPVLGVLSPLVGGYYFGGILTGIADAAREASGCVLAVQTFDAGVDQTDSFPTPGSLRLPGWDLVDGYVVVINAVTPEVIRRARDAGKPVVLVSNLTPGLNCPVVLPDNRGGIRQAVQHLFQHGHTRIAFAGCLAQSDMRERYEAYRDALGSLGLPVDPGLLYQCDSNDEHGGVRAGRAMIAAGLPSTAVVAAADQTAIGVLQALAAAGLSLPGDQAVVGFDDAEAAQFTNPRLSTVRQDFRAVGAMAGGLLLAGLRGEPADAAVYRVPTSLVLRDSCGCAPADRSRLPGDVVFGPASREHWARTLQAALGARTESASIERHLVGRLSRALEQAFLAAAADRPYLDAELRASVTALYELDPDPRSANIISSAVRSWADGGSAVDPSPRAIGRHQDIVDAVGAALGQAQVRTAYEQATYFRDALATQFSVGTALLGVDAGDSRDLRWLSFTNTSAASLGLPTGRGDLLELVSTYDALDPQAVAASWSLPLGQFPPTDLIAKARDGSGEVVFAFPLRARGSDWGWLGILGPVELRDLTGRQSANQWAALLTVALDVTAKEERLASLSQEMSVILESSPDPIVRYDASLRYRFMNAAAAAALGVEPGFAIGRTDAQLNRGVEVAELWESELKRVVANVESTEFDYATTEAGEERHFQTRLVPMLGVDGQLSGVLASSRDITALKQAEQDLAHQAVHDPLTGLANRVLLLDRLSQAVAQLERRPGTLAVLFIDLDRFKEVNDSFGHETGDRLLIQVAQRILAGARRTDTLARFGGDEFVLLCDRLAEDEDVRIIGERLGRSLAEPFFDGNRQLSVSASIGIVATSDPYVDIAAVIRDSDEAMYTAKSRGRDRFHVFDEQLRERATARHSLEADLRHALERGEFSLAYQPLFALETGAVLGVEALIRWQHPERGNVPPDEFISLAEQRGLILSIGSWVLDEALRQLAEWGAVPELTHLGVAVNLSARQLSDADIVSVVADALAKHGIAPGRLTLEITETALIEDGGHVQGTLAAISALGVRLALDDFGTGYSSLVHLRDFPVNILKIDRSFVQQLDAGHRVKEIIGALIAMAHFLDMTVVAEGIEAQQEWDQLRELGCDEGQGYLVSRPLKAPELAAFMSRRLR